jgi:NitT/TauT family transport system substrate-binding protein
VSDPGRRDFLLRAGAFGAAGLLPALQATAAEAPPEVTRVRLVHSPAICLAPQYLAEELLRLEGFSEIDYVEVGALAPSVALASGQADFTQEAAPAAVKKLDTGSPLVVLAGIHTGCYELFGNDRVRSVRDLKGKSVGVLTLDGSDRLFLSSMLAYVGIDANRDVNWVETGSFDAPMQLFIDGKTDAFLGFPPQPQHLRRRKVGHVIVDTAQDRPWNQYFCCMLVGTRQFASKYPNATKRIVRAYLKAADICAREPERVARYLVARGFEPRYEIGLEVLKSLPYTRWREADPQDTLRFHALRLHEVGMIKATPRRILEQGTDWRFLNELKQELKA